MDIKDVADIIEGRIICEKKDSDTEINKAFASDLMSDVLTIDTTSILLITGMVNVQTIRTAEMAEIKNILFVRNKKPDSEMIKLAEKEGIRIILTDKSLFRTCGLLFKAGVEPVY
jgi:hypothetical protein